METTEPKIHTSTDMLGDAQIKFEGEQYRGQPVLDTHVTIHDLHLCWISWADKEAFLNELQSIVERYRI